jgi:hypothetical protein
MTLFDIGTATGIQEAEAHQEADTYLAQQLFAKIKRTSKYAAQAGRHEAFPCRVLPQYGEYCVQGGPGGQYRLQDVSLWVIHQGKTQRIT